MKINTKSRWFWLGLGALAGLAGSRLLTRRAQEVRMPHLDVWQRELAKTRGTVGAALFAGRVQARYAALYAQRPRFAHPALRQHLAENILPGLALYQELRVEPAPAAAAVAASAALAEAEELFAAAFTGQSALFPFLKRLPDPFAVFRVACRWMLRASTPDEGWEMIITQDTRDCLTFFVLNRCFYLDMLTAYGAPELTPAFCKMDDLVYSQLAPEIIYTRTTTLGRGDDCCDFCYCRGGMQTTDTSKTDVQQLNSVSETLLLPLAYRAFESRRPDALIHDPKAAEIIAQLRYDFSKLERQQFQQLNVGLRVREFDRAVRAFLEAHPDGVVVDMGCGLDTRFERVDNGRVTWFNLDFPEVMALREQFFAPNPRSHALACSVLDFSWMDKVAQRPGPYFFLSEAMFPYLVEAEVRQLTLALRERFPGAELMFDGMPALMTRVSRLHPALRQTRAAHVRWASNDSRVLEMWGVGRLLADWRYYEQDEPRLGLYGVFRYIPFLRDFRLLHYRLGE